MAGVWSETRGRIERYAREARWREIALVEREIVDETTCVFCLARKGEVCRTGGIRPRPRTVHFERMAAFDRVPAE